MHCLKTLSRLNKDRAEPEEEVVLEQVPMGRHGVTVSVSWGYELHTLTIGSARWRKIRHGVPIIARSRGWYEGKSFPCQWSFDLNEEYSLVVTYGEDGSEGFAGKLSDAIIHERHPPKTSHV